MCLWLQGGWQGGASLLSRLPSRLRFQVAKLATCIADDRSDSELLLFEAALEQLSFSADIDHRAGTCVVSAKVRNLGYEQADLLNLNRLAVLALLHTCGIHSHSRCGGRGPILVMELWAARVPMISRQACRLQPRYMYSGIRFWFENRSRAVTVSALFWGSTMEGRHCLACALLRGVYVVAWPLRHGCR